MTRDEPSNPYAAPLAPIEAGPADPGAPTVEPSGPRISALHWLGVTIALDALGAALAALTAGSFSAPIAAALFGLSIVTAVVACVRGFVAIGRIARGRTRRVRVFAVGELVAGIAALWMTGIGFVLTIAALGGFRRGRQIRSFGRILLPTLSRSQARGAAWTDRARALDAIDVADPALRAPLAAQWRENARTEHASVAAFARLTLDLMALGAPPSLVADANRDALDEIRHAEMCFSLARAIDGELVGPAPFPEVLGAVRAGSFASRARTAELARLAVDSLVDGALHEGVSATVVAQLAKRCEIAPIRATLKEIAADEGRHAAHGWAVVVWCVAEGGAPIIDALRGAIAALPPELLSERPAASRDGAWERYGLHGDDVERAAYVAMRRTLADRVARFAPPVPVRDGADAQASAASFA